MNNLLINIGHYFSFLYHQDPLVFWTLVILILYTYFTYRLWRESVNQTGLGLMPIPAFYFRKISGKDVLRIRNLGTKPMINTRIEDWNLFVFDDGGAPVMKWLLKISIPFPNIIKADEEKALIFKTYRDGSESNLELWPHLNPEYAKFIIPLKITFQDIRGVKYKATFSMGAGNLSLTKPPKKINIFNSTSDYFSDIFTNYIGPKYLYYKFKLETLRNKRRDK